MLFGLQQLFSSSPAKGMTESLKGQELDLANLSKTEGLGDFELEMLNSLGEMNPEDAQAFIATLPKELQGQIEKFFSQEKLALPETNTKVVSQSFAQDPKVFTETVEIEQSLEADGIQEKSSLKDLFSTIVGKKNFDVKSQLVEKDVTRSPAIDFDSENIDKKLMDFEDFSLQKNIVKKHTAQPTYPGLESKKELNLKTTEVVQGTTETSGQVQNSAQFVLNTLIEAQGPQGSSQDTFSMKVETAAPVFDAGQIKSSDVKTIMDQISNYIVQAKASKEPTVNFKMNHSELGQIDITVAKAMQAGDAVAINIGANAVEGKNFFTQNLKELTTHLTQAGITVSDIRVESPSAGQKSDFDFNQHQRHADSGQKQFGSEQNQRRHDQERRQNLWDLLSNREAA